MRIVGFKRIPECFHVRCLDLVRTQAEPPDLRCSLSRCARRHDGSRVTACGISGAVHARAGAPQLGRGVEAGDQPRPVPIDLLLIVVGSDLPLQSFRVDCAFLWLHRDLTLPGTYLLTYYYLLSAGYKPLLDRLPEDDLFGVYTVLAEGAHIFRDRLDSALEITFPERVLGISRRKSCCVLDIGSGHWRLADRLTQASTTSRSLRRCRRGVHVSLRVLRTLSRSHATGACRDPT
jgi:hypothetical protein